MNPARFSQMMKYLTRVKKQKPDLPDVFPASKAPIPAKTQNVEEIEAINRFNRANPRQDMAGGGMLVQPGFGGMRQGYREDNPGSLFKQKNGYVVQFGDSKSENKIFKYFGPREYGSVAKAKKTAEKFKTETGKTWKPQQTNPGIKQATAEKAIQELLDEGTEITTKNILDNMPKKIVKEGVADSVLTKAKKQFKNLDFKRVSSFYIKAPKEVAAVKRLIEDGLPLKEIQAKGFSIKFIKNVAKNSELKIAETGYEYYKNIQKITKDLTKIGNNNKIKQAFEKGTVSKELLNDIAKITKSKDPFYDSRLLFKLAEYYDGTLESWYKPKILKITDNQKINANKVIQTSSIFQGGKRSGYAYQSNLYDWGAKQIDQALDLPLGTFRNIQKDIAKTLPSGISLDEVFGVKSSGRYAPIEGVLTNPLESKINVTKGDYVDNVKSAYQKQLIDAAGDLKKQKQILKEYNETISKSKVRYPDVEFPNYEVGKSPNKTIKNFGKLPPLIQKQLLDNYKKTGIAPTTKKAVNIFDIAKATDSPTFSALDKKTQVKLTSTDKKILNKIQSYSKLPECKVNLKADGGRIGFSNSITCIQDGLKQQKIAAQNGNKKAAQELMQVSKVATRAGLLKNLLGPGALLGEAVIEGAIIGNKVLGGKPADIAYAESYLSYLDPRKYRGELDPLKMRREDMLTREVEDAEGNIKTINAPGFSALKSGFAAQDQLSAFNEAVEDRDLAKARNRIDQYLPAAADAREQGARADQSANIISSDSVKDASRVAQEYLQGQTGANMAKYRTDDFGKFESGRDKDIRRQRMQEMSNIMPRDFFTEKTSDLLNRTQVLKSLGYDVSTRDLMEQREAMKAMPLSVAARMYSPEQVYGTQGEFAGGGIAKLAGVSSGPPPESGPNPQGLLSLKNRVRNY